MSKTGPLSYSPTPWALAAARVEQRHGSGFATEFSKSWPMRGGHDEGWRGAGKTGQQRDASDGGGGGGGSGDGIIGRSRGR